MTTHAIAVWRRYPSERAVIARCFVFLTAITLTLLSVLALLQINTVEKSPEIRVYLILGIAAAAYLFINYQYRIGAVVRAKVHKYDQGELAAGMPAYCVHQLNVLVPMVLESPTSVFVGLRQKGRLRWGLAFCGKPDITVDNDCEKLAAPPDQVFCVYMDPAGYIFDWDWVKEDRKNPGMPFHWKSRFRARLISPPTVLLKLPRIAPSTFEPGIWYSRVGGCSFNYYTDQPAYADRKNDLITIFRDITTGKMTGMKMKRSIGIADFYMIAKIALGRRESEIPPLWGIAMSAALGRPLKQDTRVEMAMQKPLKRKEKRLHPSSPLEAEAT